VSLADDRAAFSFSFSFSLRGILQFPPILARQAQETQKALENQGFCTVLAKDGESWQGRKVTPTGFEPVLPA
jgi:hypothetical protein